MAGRVRPTLRCLREDLRQAIPRADTPLNEIGHSTYTGDLMPGHEDDLRWRGVRSPE